VDWTIAGDLQGSDATGYRIEILPEKTTSHSYMTDSWYLGGFCFKRIVGVTPRQFWLSARTFSFRRWQLQVSTGTRSSASPLMPSANEKTALYSGTAARVYRLTEP
jgi:hypothetical protein